MTDLPPDFAARVRAARSYAGSNRDEFATALGVSATTIKNYENGGHKPSTRAIGETVRLLAKASGLREWFFTVPSLSTMQASGASSVDRRLTEIEQKLDRLLDALTQRQQQPAGPTPMPEGPLARVLEDDPPSQTAPKEAPRRRGRVKRTDAA